MFKIWFLFIILLLHWTTFIIHMNYFVICTCKKKYFFILHLTSTPTSEWSTKSFFCFPLQVLCSWLSNNPNYEEITKWYLGWKSLFSENLLSHPLVKEKLNEALDIMNRAVASGLGQSRSRKITWSPLYIFIALYRRLILPSTSPMSFVAGGYMQPGARENIAYLIQTERRKDFQCEPLPERREVENSATRPPGTAAVPTAVPTNFKDLVQAKAEENGIVFMPLVAKRHMGKQLFTFGRIVIYIERGVVFVQGEKTWVPTSLQSLIDMAKWDWWLVKDKPLTFYCLVCFHTAFKTVSCLSMLFYNTEVLNKFVLKLTSYLIVLCTPLPSTYYFL